MNGEVVGFFVRVYHWILGMNLLRYALVHLELVFLYQQLI